MVLNKKVWLKLNQQLHDWVFSWAEAHPETLLLIYNTMSRKQQAMEEMHILAMRVNKGVGMFFAHMTEENRLSY